MTQDTYKGEHMTTKYSFAEVLDRLEDIVDEFGPDTKQPYCINKTETEGMPVCIVGCLLDDLDVQIPGGYYGASFGDMPDSVHAQFDIGTRQFLQDLQRKVDEDLQSWIPADGAGPQPEGVGFTWGEGLSFVKEDWGLA